MDVNDISVFLNCIEPNIKDIYRVKAYLDKTTLEYDEIEDLINYLEGNSIRIINYENQDIINNYLQMISIDEKDYEAIKYLVSNDKVKELPQWLKAKQTLDSFLDFLVDRKHNIQERVDILSYAYMEKYIAKRYYDMFSKNDIMINDSEMFMNLLNRLDLPDNVKINVIKESIEQSIKNYNKETEKIESDELLRENSKYLSNKYTSMLDNAIKYIDLSKNIDELLEKKHKDYTKDNLVLLKRVWIINELNKKNIEDKREKLIEDLNDLVRY